MSIENVYEEAAQRYRSPHMQAQWDQAASLFEEAFSQLKPETGTEWVTARHLVIVGERQWHTLGNGGRVKADGYMIFTLSHATLGEVTTQEQVRGVLDVFDLARDDNETRAALRAAIKAAFPA